MSKTRITKNNTKAIIDAMSSDRLAKAVMAGGFVLETAIKTSMAAASHSGRVYGGHRASAPGETPAVDTGIYINSIVTQLELATSTNAIANVGTGQERGEWLEFGTSKMAARPHFRPAFDKTIEKIKAVIRRFAKENIEGAAT